MDYKNDKGQFRSLVYDSELPMSMQSSFGNKHGYDNRSGRTRLLVNKLFELANTFGKNIYIETFWKQMQTFTCKISESGNEKWESIDKKHYKDDVVFSSVFAYLCSICFERRTPRQIGIGEKAVYKTKYELVRDSNLNLTRQAVRRQS